MVQNKETYPETQCGGAAVKECCRIIATTLLSLLLPLSFLLLSRLSAARYFSSINDEQFHKFSILISFFLQIKTTLILSLLVSAVAIGALTHSLTGHKPPFLISERRRFHAAWVLLFVMQICLSLGIYGTVDAEINGYTIGKLVPARRAVFALGLHEMMIFWRRNVVKPAVDETIFGFSGEGFSWAEKAVLAVAFGNLWWRSLREEAEALVVLPWVRVGLGMDVEAMDGVGWGLYYLTAAIGGVWVVKGFLWGLTRIFR
ncbi:hypothetical protein ACS0TY_005181 [Phlomoides rotata]